MIPFVSENIRRLRAAHVDQTVRHALVGGVCGREYGRKGMLFALFHFKLRPVRKGDACQFDRSFTDGKPRFGKNFSIFFGRRADLDRARL